MSNELCSTSCTAILMETDFDIHYAALLRNTVTLTCQILESTIKNYPQAEFPSGQTDADSCWKAATLIESEVASLHLDEDKISR